MRFSKYNHEGYHDPTVYEAFTGIEKERKQEKQAVKQLRASYAVYRPIVYICSPYAGNVKQNVRRAQAYCRFAVQKNCVPIATHLLFPQFMDDTDPAQRQQALFMSRLLLTKCNEVWVFGETISQGMASEIRKAESRNKTMLNQYASCLYSTHSHTPEAPRYRIITPLTRDVSPEEYLALTRLLAKEWGIDCVDSCSYRAHQLMYWPTTPSNGEYVFERFDGAWLNPDAFLSAHPGWRDVSLLPTSSRESTLIDRQSKQQADPLAKPGIVGAFCRTYSIEDAIDTFLPDVYQPSAMAGRYDYVPADSSAGVVLYDGKFAYSHHATDPACGQLLSAFDLVRIHRFRDLDDKASADTAPSKLPLYKAMCDFAVQDAGVKKTLAEDRAAQAQEDFKADDNWQAHLDLERNGTIKDTMANISAILRHDPKLQGIVYNQFSNLLDVREALPWQQVKPGWSDTDLACAKLYFERCYGIWSPTKFKDALLAVTSAERLYHPVRDYLESLVWDGMPRLDTLLIDYLGADDKPYVRAATRKTLTAGVARIYEPGVKFDSILVLNGPQGIGKSTFFARLGKKWYSDSLTIADTKDKTAPEKLQGYWLLEISELAGMKKMDVETVKSFITRTDDKYRQSYGVSVESHPRSCIIVGTTNSDGGFLRDITGNRRFWPVHVPGGSAQTVFALTQSMVD